VDRWGVDVLAATVDVGDPEQVVAFAAAALDRLGPPAGVVNNAAVLGPVGALDPAQLERWAEALRIGVVGPAAVTAAFAPAMGAAGRGSVVNLSGGGIGGPATAPRLSAYLTAKAAVVQLTEVLARELAPVRVNAIAPGAVATDFTREILDAGPEQAGDELYRATVAQQEAGASLGAFLDLLDFVLDDESSWLTGRLLSARWDPPDSLRRRRAEIEASSLLQLRRIDGDRYREHPGSW
jgi:NAD(P)-dependent dehydrogenase (short-subunit alcohol dehydrogenase family)